jgi:hypothetical protein
MANQSSTTPFKGDRFSQQNQQNQQLRDTSLPDSHRELLELVERHYERTGDPALAEIVARAKRAIPRR